MAKTTRITVDAVIVDNDSVVLIKRKNPPFKGMYALPGGFVDYNESVEEALVREAKEETGLDVNIERLVGVYSAPGRDPRGHTVSICFLCRVSGGGLAAGSDAETAEKFKIEHLPKLAFDHKRMIHGCLDKRNTVCLTRQTRVTDAML
ncbi:MAG: DNA mismatch repair protein MutT [Candidatus Altiarchaeales archaeon IMC4]|nr:MAG: DNA mismatch repair protein MutT [Candidatus Altiarchaeales archaeon IMC4]